MAVFVSVEPRAIFAAAGEWCRALEHVFSLFLWTTCTICFCAWPINVFHTDTLQYVLCAQSVPSLSWLVGVDPLRHSLRSPRSPSCIPLGGGLRVFHGERPVGVLSTRYHPVPEGGAWSRNKMGHGMGRAAVNEGLHGPRGGILRGDFGCLCAGYGVEALP